jgi:hypothetical protein
LGFLPEIEPFFHGVGVALIWPQSLIAHGPGSCGLVVAGSRQRVQGTICGGCEDADCSASKTVGHTEDVVRCVDADTPHLVVLGALSTSAMRALFGLRRLVYRRWDSDKKSPAEAGLSSIDRVCRGGGKPTSQHRPAPLVSVSKARRSTGWQQREAKPRRRGGERFGCTAHGGSHLDRLPEGGRRLTDRGRGHDASVSLGGSA